MALVLSVLPAVGAAQDATPAADHSDIEIAYVLHGLNAFTAWGSTPGPGSRS